MSKGHFKPELLNKWAFYYTAAETSWETINYSQPLWLLITLTPVETWFSPEQTAGWKYNDLPQFSLTQNLQSHGDYTEVENFRNLLEIEIFRNSLQKFDFPKERFWMIWVSKWCPDTLPAKSKPESQTRALICPLYISHRLSLLVLSSSSCTKLPDQLCLHPANRSHTSNLPLALTANRYKLMSGSTSLEEFDWEL